VLWVILTQMDHEFLQQVDGRIGEGFGGAGVTSVHINLVVARTGSATAAAATAALANPSPGHVPFLVCAGAGTVIRPATVFINKTTLTHPNLERATWGGAQLGISEAILDAVADGILPRSLVDDLVLLVAAWIDPQLADVELSVVHDAELRSSAHGAMVDAINDAVTSTNPQVIDSLLARRSTITNAFSSALRSGPA
jgi:5,6,7,8-tetrahydromethanopterin hydro-lyase